MTDAVKQSIIESRRKALLSQGIILAEDHATNELLARQAHIATEVKEENI